MSELLAGLRSEADMRRLLVIGGDVDTSGVFADALAVIQKGRLREAGIEEIGIGGYPEGHPRIAQGLLEAALDQKIAAARAAGLRVFIVSQFSFSGDRILAWLRQLRACGIAVPVKVGLAGPASVTALLRYAKRCGVSASLRGLMSGAAAGLIGNAGPDRIVQTLAAAGELGTAPHYFSFGGTVETARYACDAAAGRIAAGHAMAQSIRAKTCQFKLRPAANGSRALRGGNHDAKNQAAISRRPCRQHSAHRAGQAGARATREGRDYACSTQRG